MGRLTENQNNYAPSLLDKAHIRVIEQLGPDLPVVPLDKNKMEQVFVNLIVNSVQAMPEGGTLTLRTSNGFGVGAQVVVVEIEDTGAGIPPEILPKIFDPFFTTKSIGKGTGLGLTVSRNIVELHGGTINIRNREEGGVRVALLLKTGKGG